jgi:hypothetical protein
MPNKITDTTILDCGHVPSKHSEFTTGYGLDKHNKTFCYDCCAENDKKSMRENGRVTLYLSEGNKAVTNWPDSLHIPTTNIRYGKHNIAGTRVDVWFKFEGKYWHGAHYGESSTLVYCKQMKS